MIVKEEGRQFVRDLTLEYVRQNNLLQCNKQDLPEKLDIILETENIINDYVEKRYKDFRSL